MSLSTHVLDFGSELVGGASDAMPVTLTNVGTVNLNIASIVAGGDYSQTNDCPAVAAPAGTCTINAVFEPTMTGPLAGTVTITDDATDSPQTVTLNGTGVAPNTPHMELSASNLDFGEQTINTPSDAQTVTLTNNGTAAINGALSATLTITNNSSDSPQTITLSGTGIGGGTGGGGCSLMRRK